jgi:hypothetical protein
MKSSQNFPTNTYQSSMGSQTTAPLAPWCNYSTATLPPYPQQWVADATVTSASSCQPLFTLLYPTCYELVIPQLPQDARRTHLLPGLTHSSLVSIGKLCDEGCEATFDKNKVVVSKDKMPVLTGTRDTRTGLWRFPMQTPQTPTDIHTHQPTMCRCTTTTHRHMPNDTISACSGIQSSQIDLDYGHQARILHHLSGINYSSGQ